MENNERDRVESPIRAMAVQAGVMLGRCPDSETQEVFVRKVEEIVAEFSGKLAGALPKSSRDRIIVEGEEHLL